MDSLLSELRNPGSRPFVLFNGFWNFHPGMMEDQAKLLPYADAAAVEFFGYQGQKGSLPFGSGILPYLKVVAAHPNKVFVVFGRGPTSYVDYETDYLWQRYLYCAYLLAAGPNTYFKYNATFQAPAYPGRSGGVTTYADWEIVLGPSLAPFSARDGVYSREFRNGIVVVAPFGGRAATYVLPRTFYTPEGDRLVGRVELKPGTGLILLNQKPPAPAPIRYLLGSDPSPLASSQGALQVRDGDQTFLRLTDLRQSGDWEHDLMLDPIRTLHPRRTLRLRVRSRTADAKLQLVAEVDDAEHQRRFVLIEATAQQTSSKSPNTVTETWFRSSASRWAFPYVRSPVQLSTTGQWQDITIDGSEILRRTGRFTFARWWYVRPRGAMDIEIIEIR
jgi:hypothetical protein